MYYLFESKFNTSDNLAVIVLASFCKSTSNINDTFLIDYILNAIYQVHAYQRKFSKLVHFASNNCLEYIGIPFCILV